MVLFQRVLAATATREDVPEDEWDSPDEDSEEGRNEAEVTNIFCETLRDDPVPAREESSRHSQDGIKRRRIETPHEASKEHEK